MHVLNQRQRHAIVARRVAPYILELAEDPALELDRSLLALKDPVRQEAVVGALQQFRGKHRDKITRVVSDRASRSARLQGLEQVVLADAEWADRMWWLLAPPSPSAQTARGSAGAARASGGRFIRRSLMTIVLVALITVVVGIAVIEDLELLPRNPLPLFAIGALSFLPGWLFIRFLGQRAEALWYEYVLNLHRLGLDDCQNLPQPPATSSYYRDWLESGGPVYAHDANVYREKFDAFYGKKLAESVEEGDARVAAETVFPVVLTTVVLAVGWSAVFSDGITLEEPSSLADMMAFAFLGAYVFSIQMLVRRFFQSDLRSGAYAHVIVRVLTSLVLVAIIHQLPLVTAGQATASWSEPLVAFLVGVFPLVGVQALLQAAARPLRVVVPSLRPSYPLNQLHGLNVWYEARLLEEGVEDMQNLATANLVDVMLHTRVPVGRLIDWIDQSYLLTHLPRDSAGWLATVNDERRTRAAKRNAANPSPQPRLHPKEVLRQAGITRATELVHAIPLDDEGLPTTARGEALVEWISAEASTHPSAVTTLVHLLAEEPGLNPMRSWYDGAARLRCSSSARPPDPVANGHGPAPDGLWIPGIGHAVPARPAGAVR